MKTNNRDIDYRDYIKSIKLDKKSDLLICIPTYNSYGLTKNTINSFLMQNGVSFDICIIGSTLELDYLKKDFPDLNIVYLKTNYGCTGAYYLSAIISQLFEYEYTMINDNEAVFLKNDSLRILLDFCVNNSAKVCAATPYNIDYGVPVKNISFQI